MGRPIPSPWNFLERPFRPLNLWDLWIYENLGALSPSNPWTLKPWNPPSREPWNFGSCKCQPLWKPWTAWGTRYPFRPLSPCTFWYPLKPFSPWDPLTLGPRDSKALEIVKTFDPLDLWSYEPHRNPCTPSTLTPTGSITLKSDHSRRGLEPDETYHAAQETSFRRTAW